MIGPRYPLRGRSGVIWGAFGGPCEAEAREGGLSCQVGAWEPRAPPLQGSHELLPQKVMYSPNKGRLAGAWGIAGGSALGASIQGQCSRPAFGRPATCEWWGDSPGAMASLRTTAHTERQGISSGMVPKNDGVEPISSHHRAEEQLKSLILEKGLPWRSHGQDFGNESARPGQSLWSGN